MANQSINYYPLGLGDQITSKLKVVSKPNYCDMCYERIDGYV